MENNNLDYNPETDKLHGVVTVIIILVSIASAIYLAFVVV